MQLKNSAIALVLLFAFSLQIGSKCLIWANYLLNKKEITNLFCVNKSKPKMNCNGKCHLKKQLKEQDKKEQSPASSLKEVKEIQLYNQSTSITSVKNSSEDTSSELNIIYLLHTSSKHTHSVFHPPLA